MISSDLLKNALISAAENIKLHAEEVDALNVFPVPDGDTGTNLSLTLGGCTKAVAEYESVGAGDLADFAAGRLLRCARGNSGVIFSLIFKGFAESIKGLENIDSAALAKGLEAGCDEAYASVDKPTEGTMLTVIRIAASKAHSAAQRGKSPEETFAAALSGAKASLKSTPNLLPILKKHGVVDAGGQGLVYIMEGMLGAKQRSFSLSAAEKPTNPVFEKHTDIPFAYCTEFIINNAECGDIAELRQKISREGDCPAVAEHSGIIKIHVHTNRPDRVLAAGLECGELSDIKIDNMRLQASSRSCKCGMISLCSGDGIKSILESNKGVSALECSGSMNASAEEILQAINRCPCESVIVSPNNKNAVLAAKQAAEMSGKPAFVGIAKNPAQGIAAARVFNPALSARENLAKAQNAVPSVLCGSVTYAAKDGVFEGKAFFRGQILGIESENIIYAGEDMNAAAVKVAERLLEKSVNKKALIIYGKDADERNAEKAAVSLRSRCKKAKIDYVYGGQPLYYYIISAE